MAWLLGPIDDFLLGTLSCAELEGWLHAVERPALTQLGSASIEPLRAAAADPELALTAAEALYVAAFRDRHLRLAVAAAADDMVDSRVPIAESCSRLENLRQLGAEFVSMVFKLYNPPPAHVMNADPTLLFAAYDLRSNMITAPGIEDALERRRRRAS